MGRHHQRSHREAAHLQHSKVNSSELEENRYHHFRRQQLTSDQRENGQKQDNQSFSLTTPSTTTGSQYMQHQTTFKTSPLPRCFSAMEPSIPALPGWYRKLKRWHSTLTKHLHRYQDLQGHTERRRYSKDLEESRRNRSPTIQEICYNQDETTDAEGKISKRHHRFNGISSEILHLG